LCGESVSSIRQNLGQLDIKTQEQMKERIREEGKRERRESQLHTTRPARPGVASGFFCGPYDGGAGRGRSVSWCLIGGEIVAASALEA
jgi:hypothetical protein